MKCQCMKANNNTNLTGKMPEFWLEKYSINAIEFQEP